MPGMKRMPILSPAGPRLIAQQGIIAEHSNDHRARCQRLYLVRSTGSPAGPVQVTVSPDTLKLAGVAVPNSADTCVAAVAVLSTVPAKPAAGEQVMRPRQGKLGCRIVTALSL